MAGALKKAMLDVGLDFDPDAPSRLPDTTDAHRLIRWAAEEDAAHAMKGALFEAYWQHGEDIGLPDVLGQAVEVAGLNPDDMLARLETAEDREAVRQEAAELRGGGVSGIPAFIINEQAGFEGALPKADLLATLKELAAETEAPA